MTPSWRRAQALHLNQVNMMNFGKSVPEDQAQFIVVRNKLVQITDNLVRKCSQVVVNQPVVFNVISLLS